MRVESAGIFIINKHGELLICHPTFHKVNFWSIPKGKVEDLESYKEAAIRETLEETNIDLSEYSDKLIMLDKVNYSHKKKCLIPFVLIETECFGLDLTKQDIKCNSRVSIDNGGFLEMDDFKFCNITEARKLLHETQVACLDDVTKIAVDKIVNKLNHDIGFARD